MKKMLVIGMFLVSSCLASEGSHATTPVEHAVLALATLAVTTPQSSGASTHSLRVSGSQPVYNQMLTKKSVKLSSAKETIHPLAGHSASFKRGR